MTHHEPLFPMSVPEKANSDMSSLPKFRLLGAAEEPLNGAMRDEIVTVTAGELRQTQRAGGDAAGDEEGQRMFHQVLDLGAPTMVRDVEAQFDHADEVLSASKDGRRYRTIARFHARGYKRLSATHRYWRLSYPIAPDFNRPAASIPARAQGISGGLQTTKTSRHNRSLPYRFQDHD